MMAIWQINFDKNGVKHTLTFNDCPPPADVHQLHHTNIDFTCTSQPVYWCGSCNKFCVLMDNPSSRYAGKTVVFIEPRLHESGYTSHG